MNKRSLIALAIASLLALWLVHNALAMSSTNYRIDWMIAGTANGGGAASSTNYAARVTVGQGFTGAMTSPAYRTNLGYWYILFPKTYLPLILR